MRPVPSGNTVDLWWFDTGAMTVGAADLAMLDAGETQRAGSFLFPADRHRYQRAHVALRQVLADYCGTAPGDLSFRRDPCPRCGKPSGKPVLAAAFGATPRFSLAHSGDMVVIAVAGHPVGVDVERDPLRCVCSLAGVLHADDAAALAGLAEPERHDAVIGCWVRVEAVLKCTGESIVHGLGGFPVGADGPTGPTGPADTTGTTGTTGTAGIIVHGCSVRELSAPPPYRAAVALAGTGAIAPGTPAPAAERAR
jgi:4'-phosphopantetheinyl transferase